jgi:hypothetical protein
MKTTLWLGVLMAVSVGAVGSMARAETNNRDAEGATPSGLKPQTGDVVEPRHLSLTRAFAGIGKLTVNFCDAGVRLGNRLHVQQMAVTVSRGVVC